MSDSATGSHDRGAGAWAGILAEGEEILWQGRPSTRLHLRARQIPTMLFGVLFACFALFWMIGASQAGGIFWMFGLIHFSVGLAMITEPALYPAFRRRRSFYTLTNRGAFIGTDLPVQGRKLNAYPITPATRLELEITEPGSVYFARSERRRRFSFGNRRIGFEYIPDATAVYALLSSIQKGTE
ncbi:MAG: aspartate carbamoyltransferase catalytic subunit [Paracoccus sp. (in: a-proteobacteria)]